MTNLNRLFTLGDPYSCKEYKTRAYKERIRKKIYKNLVSSKYYLTLVHFKIKVQIASKPQQSTDKKRNVDRNSKPF